MENSQKALQNYVHPSLGYTYLFISMYEHEPVYQVDFCTLILTLMLWTVTKAWKKFNYVHMSK